MTRYLVIQSRVQSDPSSPRVLERSITPHPEMPKGGFDSWAEAEAWLHERFLAPHIWSVEPYAEDF